MNKTIKSYFALAKSNTHSHEFIVRDLEFFLKSMGISDSIITLKDDFDLSKEQIKKIERAFINTKNLFDEINNEIKTKMTTLSMKSPNFEQSAGSGGSAGSAGNGGSKVRADPPSHTRQGPG